MPNLPINKIICSSSKAGSLIAGYLMLFVSLAICYEVVMRHFFNLPTEWVMSFSLLSFIWFPFLGVADGIRNDKHISCDVVITVMSSKTREVIGIATDLTAAIYIVALLYFGYLYFYETYELGAISAGFVTYPLWIQQIAFPVGMALSLLQVIPKIKSRLKTLREDKTDNSKKLRNRTLFLISLYVTSILFGIYIFSLNQSLGILVMALILIFWGVPIAFGLGLVGIVGLLFFHGSISGLHTLPIVAEKTLYNFVLLAIPLFSLGGVILAYSGLGDDIYDLSSKWLGWMPGGLGVATCVTGGLLAAMIGSSTAVTTIVALVAMKPLLDRGYEKTLVIGTVTGTSLGLIIPPSIGLIVYGFLTDTSVGELFMAGFIPGALLVIMFSVYVVVCCKITGKYEKEKISWKERFISLRKSFMILLGPIFVLGSIYSGMATPTEAGAILVVYSLICALIYRRMTWKAFIACLKQSSSIATMILMIMIGALTMANVVTLLQIPSNLAAAVMDTGLPSYLLLLLLMLLYLILGMFLDGAAITVLTVPVVAPMLPALGVDTVVFGIVLMMLIEAALLTPPVGLNLFTVKGIVDEDLSTIIRGAAPFVAIIIFAIIICTIFPKIVLYLPSVLMH